MPELRQLNRQIASPDSVLISRAAGILYQSLLMCRRRLIPLERLVPSKSATALTAFFPISSPESDLHSLLRLERLTSLIEAVLQSQIKFFFLRTGVSSNLAGSVAWLYSWHLSFHFLFCFRLFWDFVLLIEEPKMCLRLLKL